MDWSLKSRDTVVTVSELTLTEPLNYNNFRNRVWVPAFERLELPYVTPHSARHSFISTLQAEGVEVGLVAKIAGHSNPSVTLGYYTQAVRNGAEALENLAHAYQA